jgi:hypothetical protein
VEHASDEAVAGTVTTAPAPVCEHDDPRGPVGHSKVAVDGLAPDRDADLLVGVAPEEEDGDFDFEEALRSIHIDLKGLTEEAAELAMRISRNFEELGA